MAIVRLTGKFETSAADDCFIAINTDNLTFITPGPMEDSAGQTYCQLYFHFLGSIESIGFWVQEVEEALAKLDLTAAHLS